MVGYTAHRATVTQTRHRHGETVLFLEPPRFTQNPVMEAVGLPNAGLLSVASAAAESGSQVHYFDAKIENAYWDEIRSLIERTAPRVVGISAFTCDIYAAMIVSKIAKSLDPSITTVVGGYHPTAMSELTLRTCREIDYCVIGEGERTFSHLCEALQAGVQKPRDVHGIAFLDGGAYVRTESREFIPSLDALPLPRYDLLPIGRYYFPGIHDSVPARRGFGLSFSRGCPYSCRFCSNSTLWNRTWRARCAPSMMKELSHLQAAYFKDHFFFYDNDFLMDEARNADFARLLEGHRPPFRWSCEASPRSVLKNRDLLPTLKRHGLSVVMVGFEFPSDGHFNEYDKRATIRDSVDAYEILAGSGLIVVGLAIMGHVGETRESLQRFVRFFSEEIKPDMVYPQLLTPLPGAPLFSDMMRNRRIETFDFSKYDLFTPVLRYDNFTREQMQQAHNEVTAQLFTPLCMDLFTKYRKHRISFENLCARYFELRDLFVAYANNRINFPRMAERYKELLSPVLRDEAVEGRYRKWRRATKRARATPLSAKLERYLQDFFDTRTRYRGEPEQDLDPRFTLVLRDMARTLDKRTARRILRTEDKHELMEIFLSHILNPNRLTRIAAAGVALEEFEREKRALLEAQALAMRQLSSSDRQLSGPGEE